ncbi:von Willebrand factor type A domain-containing protein [Phycicoccus sp. CSK15P-2]|uniref:vWA domain-containing protein n=1 Tax=Phycicoccus sp. CSK15P-2 TaxID=2807627 RepID=UPI00195232C1|nr:von Willebrand factor type A domain-containing protein [Phycicoccus sp. CSK15P-2]MBM6403448.1 von Willebrand factor type A domain-containing protein [Phycicoccus sp. CSK15P-2]
MGTTHRRTSTLTGAALVIALAATGCASGSTSDETSARDRAAGPIQPGPNRGAEPPSTQLDENPPRDLRDRERPLDESMTDAAADPLSTFALDIDTGSYTRFRDAVSRGYTPPADEVRTEEFVNYFEQDYDAPSDGLDVHIDAATLPFQPRHRIVRVGIRAADPDHENRSGVDLSLVVDCSGSMREAGKMETTKTALRALVSSLDRDDRVAMVCYSTEARLALEPTRVADAGRIFEAVDSLRPMDSTNAAAGLALGYDLAADMASEERMTRVVLVSDGVANVGETTSGGILERISTEARAGINLVSVGVGIADYDDELLEQLADNGDGWHVYVDTADEAERVFAHDLTATLAVTARDAKAQVEFDPEQVAGYRLIGYENRAVADRDFRNDAVDGGEVLAGHATTALYDVELRDGGGRDAFVTATVRYLDDSGRPVERFRWLTIGDCPSDLAEASPRLRQDLVVAMLTDHLTGGPWSRWAGPEVLRREASVLPEILDGDRDVAELVGLVDRVTA